MTSRRLTLVLPTLALTALACGSPATPAIGVSTSTAFANAARLALSDARADGLDVPVDTIMVPESSIYAEPALQAAQRFVSAPGMVGVVGHSNSAASLAASPVYNEHRIVQIAPTASAVSYSQAGPYSFRLLPSDDRQGAFLSELVRDSFPGPSRLAVLYVNDEYGRGLRSAYVERQAEAAGDRVVLDLPHAPDVNVDAAAVEYLVDAVAAADPDVIVWLGRAGALDIVLPLLREKAGPIPVVGGDGVAVAQQSVQQSPAWAGVLAVEPGRVEKTEAGRSFAARYQERFDTRATAAEALTYDAMRLLLQALAEGARSGVEVRAHLRSLGRDRPPYAGILGPITFDEDGDALGGAFRVVRMVPQGAEW